MKTKTFKGEVQVKFVDKLLKYGLYTGVEYIDLDELLYNNLNKSIGVKINDYHGFNLFDREGKLILDYSMDYERYMLKNGKGKYDLDRVLWDNTMGKIEIILENFNTAIIDGSDIESEDTLTCVTES